MAILTINKETKAISLIHDSAPESAILAQSEIKLAEGSINECKSFLDNYWYENNTPEELQIFQAVK